jgi:hypothetical protein
LPSTAHDPLSTVSLDAILGHFLGLSCALTFAILSKSSRHSGVRGLSTSAAATRGQDIVKNVGVPGLTNGMDFVQLGDSNLVVSKVCMGTMTFGEQNTLDQGVEQLMRAWDEYGINFLDTAEMYPVPTKPESQGATDRAVAKFLKNRKREDIVLATKVSGRSDRITWLPRRKKGTSACLTRDQIVDSVEASLKRLGTDYIDLLQLHWPDRYTGGMFGAPSFLPSQYESSPTPVEFEALFKSSLWLVKSVMSAFPMKVHTASVP